MGYSNWSDAAYRSVSRTRTARTSQEIFRGTRSIDPLMDPTALGRSGARESRDSEHHPRSVPIIVSFDVTGSMGDIPTRFAQSLLGTLMRTLVEGGCVTDPQVLFAAIGDAVSDDAPLQIGQFESGLEMDMWLTRLWLEGGGGDAPESYLLSHWFAAHHTATDSWQKRAKKGYLFTIGDAANKPLSNRQIERVFSYSPAEAIRDAAVIEAAKERWEVFHILISRDAPIKSGIKKSWRRLLGSRMVVLDQTESICTLVATLIGLRERRLDPQQAQARLHAVGLSQAAAAELLAELEHC